MYAQEVKRPQFGNASLSINQRRKVHPWSTRSLPCVLYLLFGWLCGLLPVLTPLQRSDDYEAEYCNCIRGYLLSIRILDFLFQ